MTQNKYHQSTRSLQTTPRIMRLLADRANANEAKRATNGYARRQAAAVLETQMTILRIAKQGKHITEAEAGEIETLLRAGLPYAQAREQVRTRVASLAVLTHPEDRPAPAAPAAVPNHETQEAKNDTPEL